MGVEGGWRGGGGDMIPWRESEVHRLLQIRFNDSLLEIVQILVLVIIRSARMWIAPGHGGKVEIP